MAINSIIILPVFKSQDHRYICCCWHLNDRTFFFYPTIQFHWPTINLTWIERKLLDIHLVENKNMVANINHFPVEIFEKCKKKTFPIKWDAYFWWWWWSSSSMGIVFIIMFMLFVYGFCYCQCLYLSFFSIFHFTQSYISFICLNNIEFIISINTHTHKNIFIIIM